MWQTKYASAIPEILGLGLNFRPCSEGSLNFFFLRVHELRAPDEGINQRYLKNLADVADKICFGRT